MKKKLLVVLFIVIVLLTALIVYWQNQDFSSGLQKDSTTHSHVGIESAETARETNAASENCVEIILETDVTCLLSDIARSGDERLEHILDAVRKELSKDNQADFNNIVTSAFRAEDIPLSRYFGEVGDSDSAVLKMLNETVDDAVKRTAEILRKRIDQFGVNGVSIERVDRQRIRLSLPEVKNVERARSLIGRTALLEFKFLADKEDTQAFLEKLNSYLDEKNTGTETDDTDHPFTSLLHLFQGNMSVLQKNFNQVRELLTESEVKKMLPEGSEILWAARPERIGDEEFHFFYLVNSTSVLTGAAIDDARVDLPGGFSNAEMIGQPTVGITMNRKGTKQFARITRENIGNRLAIVLDNKVYMAPIIKAEIPKGRAVIAGMVDVDEANDIAILLRAGALPAPVKVVEERAVNPIMDR